MQALVGSGRCSMLPGALSSVVRRNRERGPNLVAFCLPHLFLLSLESVKARIVALSSLLNGWWKHTHLSTIAHRCCVNCSLEMQIHVSGIVLCSCSVVSCPVPLERSSVSQRRPLWLDCEPCCQSCLSCPLIPKASCHQLLILNTYMDYGVGINYQVTGNSA